MNTQRRQRQGSTAIGIVYNGGVLLVTDKRILDPLIISSSVEKIFQLDTHMMSAASGIISDARVLMDRAQVKAQQHMVTYDSPVDVISIVKDIADLKQLTTQSGGYRPFGVSLLIAGVDDRARLYETDPTGIYFEYKATVIGEGEPKIKPMLHSEYKEGMGREEALALAVKALKAVLDKDFSAERIDAAYVDESNKKFTRVERAEIDSASK